ncbi:DUF1684 domain-containing protein [Halostella sp. JP-L12]|uniref:DUF1684 domain-containing protein n=1 Tax=Halostella TaxID=1843185 RepID=UPI000EF773FD|nr:MULTISPECIES: DUF1684 domain-containing protein [Halostella]NHN46199.1 DUF1684 domain-containing protein [Halostella sp. JP-L12]
MTDDFDADAWRRELETQRDQKDQFFAEHRQSPVPPEERDDFDGLDYFDPDPDYRVAATVTVHDDPEPVTMDTTAGTEVRYLRELTLSFAVNGQEQELAAYRQEDDDQYFVPFRDKTTGQQTYEGGRYMEFETERDLSDGDEITLDLNLAYSPFCAYSETFACPLPPEENWLDVAVAAGERAP